MEILQRVLTDYPERLENIRIIHHTQNSGSAAVRNTGLQIAQGEYIIHCDSDDWVEPDMYKAMYAKAKETDADIVVTDFIMNAQTTLLFKSKTIRTILCFV